MSQGEFSFAAELTEIVGYCPRCDTRKPKSHFFYNNRRKNGMSAYCRPCASVYQRGFREKDPERHRARVRKSKQANRVTSILSSIRTRASKRGLPYDLDDHVEAIKSRWAAGVCEMTGVFLNMDAHGLGYDTPSIDRVDPAEGYVYSNIRIVCWVMNAAMGDWGEDKLREVMTAWLSRPVEPAPPSAPQ